MRRTTANLILTYLETIHGRCCLDWIAWLNDSIISETCIGFLLTTFFIFCRNALFRAYHATVDMDRKVLTFEEYQSDAWRVPIHVEFRPKDGRGVYATEFIPKDTLIWTPEKNTAVFHNSHEYRTFLEHLSDDPSTHQIACDSQVWIEVFNEVGKDSEFVICQTFDEATLFNTDSEQSINIYWKEDMEPANCGGYSYYASRDIQPGEQLVISYSETGLQRMISLELKSSSLPCRSSFAFSRG
jgi:hypothetical protein